MVPRPAESTRTDPLFPITLLFLFLPAGTVPAINGASRFAVSVEGMAGHAGTVPMGLRLDALAGAAEMITAIEQRAAGEEALVATVGRLEVAPGATNVIPGKASFTLDIRAPQDAQRDAAVASLQAVLDDRKRTRLTPVTNAQLVCRLLPEKKQ